MSRTHGEQHAGSLRRVSLQTNKQTNRPRQPRFAASPCRLFGPVCVCVCVGTNEELCVYQINRFHKVEDRALLITDRHLYKMDPLKQYKPMKSIPLYNVGLSIYLPSSQRTEHLVNL